MSDTSVSPDEFQIFKSNLLEMSNNSHWLINTEMKYYQESNNPLYHFQVRYEFTKDDKSNRVMLLLTGHKRACVDWWLFSVGRRILQQMRSENYTFLTICSPKETYDYNYPIEENLDVKWIYRSIQVWMNDVYFAKYQRYPTLYLYGVSRGSHFAGLLCRVLPIQAQILYIYPGYFQAMTARSSFEPKLYKRLSLDSSFASWFHFKYCYTTTSELCFFQNPKKANLNPLPPTFFLHAINDNRLEIENFTRIMTAIKNDFDSLGGPVLRNSESIRLHIIHPSNLTITFMQENFYPWRSKPHASKLFYEHFVGFPKLPEQQNSTQKDKTFWCYSADFTYFEKFPSTMQTWTDKQREEYRDYSNDIRQYKDFISEEFCGDFIARHAMISTDLEKALSWIHQIDSIRLSLKVNDILERPIRIWTYPKQDLIPASFFNHHIEVNCSYNNYSNQMYLPEHIIQEYFHSVIQTENPLLADFFLVPHDLYCFIFLHKLHSNFSDDHFKKHVSHFSKSYFQPLMNNLKKKHPYWTITDQPGSTHVITFIGGRNMGVLDANVQDEIKNVIQLGTTGIRQDLLPPNAAELYLHRNLSTVYRHGYDIVIPPFTPTELFLFNSPTGWYQSKNRLFFFAGMLDHSLSEKAARRLISSYSRNRTGQIVIDRKELNHVYVIDGHLSTRKYYDLIRSSIFLLCPEGYSPWSPRIYESMNLDSIPLIIADGIVLPFERFIPWRTFTSKVAKGNIDSLTEFVITNNTKSFETGIKNIWNNVKKYRKAFHWLRKSQARDAENSNAITVFDYILRELKCRRLEQMFGSYIDVFSVQTIRARQHVCRFYEQLCPCPEEPPIAFDQYHYTEDKQTRIFSTN